MDHPLLSEQQALDALRRGKPLRRVQLPALHFKNEEWHHPLVLEDVQVASLVFDQCTFHSDVRWERVTATGEVSLSREGAESSFHQDLLFLGCRLEGPVVGRKLSVGGNLSTKESTFLQRVNLPLARIQGRWDSAFATFESTTRFEGASVHRTASFEGCTFRQKADFRQAHFHDTVFFRAAHFHDEATFQNTVFQAGRFEDLIVDKGITFKVAQFHGKAYFHNAIFHNKLVLRGAGLHDVFYFNRVTCYGDVDAQGLEALNTATFDEATFHKSVDWTDVVFHRDVNVRWSKFHGPLSLDRGIFRMRLDVDNTVFTSTIGLYGVNANELLLERQQVEGKIDAALSRDYERAKHAYILLRNHFDLQGKHEDADWAYYRFRQAERRSDKEEGILAASRRFFNWFLFDLGSGYGTKPLNVTFLAVFVILVFAGLFWMNGSFFVIDPAIGGSPQQSLSFAQALYISASTFTTLGTDGIAPRFDHWLKYLVVMEGFLGLFLMTVFVGVYTRKMAK